ncbi:unnamed protein product, partial [Mesorhabditis spiculigera]
MDPQGGAPTTGMKISFGVKKKVEQKIEQTVTVIDHDSEHSEDEVEVTTKRKLFSMENGVITLDEDEVKVKKPKKEFVIPLVKESDWRVQKLKEMALNGTITDEDRAKLVLLTGEDFSEMTTETTTTTTTEEIAVVVNPNEKSTEDADYAAIPIESFGLAILRGCGWKDGEGIGKNPQIVKMKVSHQRPKGLGLGAKPPAPQTAVGKNKEEEEELSGEIVKGSRVKITVKPNIGKYGMVEGRDDDNNSCFVRLALGKNVVRVSLFGVAKVTKKEYDAKAHVLNQANYEQEAKRLKAERESYRAKEQTDDRRESDKRDRRRDERDYREVPKIDPKELWVRPDLIVRFVNEDYKKGRYMSQKMRVVDVADIKNLTLEDDSGNQHYEIRQTWVETVVPRNAGERVMIVRGKNRGKPAVVEDKDKRTETLVLRLLSTNEIKKVYFDDACMWKPPAHYESD